MSQPVAYVPGYTYLTVQGIEAWFPGQYLDVEFQAIKTTTDQIRANLALIQRDDGGLLDGIVTYNSLAATLQTNNLAPADAWVTATAYVEGDPIVINGNLYRALVDHTSGVFATDLAAAKWIFVAALPAGPAGTNGTNGVVGVSGTPTANQVAVWTNATTLQGLTLLPVAAGGTNLGSGTSGGILGYTAAGVLASSILLTANALLLGGGAGATPVPMASLGTTTTVLHGNAAGAPTFGAVGLTTDVTGTLPVANGGTGIATTTAYSVICAGTTATGAFQSLAALGASGTVLTSNGAGALPSFQAAGGGSAAAQADLETQTDNTKFLTSLNIKWAPGVAKGWCEWGVSSTIGASQNVSSVTDTGTGNWTVNWTTSFSSANYAYTTAFLDAAATSVRMIHKINAVAAGTITYQTFPADATGALTENASDRHSVTAHGDFA